MAENATLVADYRQMDTYLLATAGVGIAVILMILEFIALSGFSPSVSGDDNFRRRNLQNRRMDKGNENYEISKSSKRERRRIKDSLHSKKFRRMKGSLISNN
jgi:hypothetical protein